jgi:hypothetical protein
MSLIKLSEVPKYKKYQLATLMGYTVKETNKETGRCYISGADNYIDNDFKSIDEFLLTIKKDLYSRGFNVAA